MLKVIGGVPDGEYKAIASGSLPNGKPVIVNSDGTVSVVEQTTETGTETMGSETQLPTTSNGTAYFLGGTYDSTNGKVLFTYRDQNNSQKGTVVVGTVSGSSVTWGTPVVFEQGRTQWTSAAFDSVNGKVVIAYQDQDNSFYGTAIVGTVSGNSISFGTPVVFESAESTYIDTAYDASAGAIVINWANNVGAGGRVIAGTVSGTSITFGSIYTFDGSTGIYGRSVYHPEEQCTIIAWRSGAAGYGRAITVSGTTITMGTTTAYQTGGQVNQNDIAYDADSKKIVIIARDEANLTYGSSWVGTVSGTTLTFASPVTFQTGSVDWMGIEGWYTGGVAMTYDNQSVSNRITFKFGTISGTTITWGTGTDLYVGTGNNGYTGWAMDTANNKLVMAYNANYVGKYRVYNPDYTAVTNNLTAENYIGMSKGVVESTGSPASVGSSVTFNAGTTYSKAAVYDPNTQKVVIAYVDNGNSNYGTAIVGTVSGTSISFGTEVVFDANPISMPYKIVYDPDSQKVVIAYKNTGVSQGKAVVGTVSGTSISFGSVATFTTSDARGINMIYDTVNDRVVVPYMDFSNSSYGTAAVGTVSGTSISFGTPVVFQSENTSSGGIGAAFDTSNGKTVFTYIRRSDSDSGYAIVGTVSGTSISFGTAVKFNNGETYYNACGYDSNAGKILAVFADYQDGSAITGKAIVGTVSGTSISFGTAAQFFGDYPIYINTEYDSTIQQTLIIFRDQRGTDQYSNIIQGTISGTTVTFNDPLEIPIKSNAGMDLAYDTNQNKTVVVLGDLNDSQYGKSFVYTADTETTNRYPVADGDPARVDIIGSVSTNQLSLTAGEKYYVQNDGTLSTTAGSPSVLAGTAISATKLVVKT